jgi:hypothetical protein
MLPHAAEHVQTADDKHNLNENGLCSLVIAYGHSDQTSALHKTNLRLRVSQKVKGLLKKSAFIINIQKRN